MENMVRATLISNAGLLLEYREVKLLVDAIYHTTGSASRIFMKSDMLRALGVVTFGVPTR